MLVELNEESKKNLFENILNKTKVMFKEDHYFLIENNNIEKRVGNYICFGKKITLSGENQIIEIKRRTKLS